MNSKPTISIAVRTVAVTMIGTAFVAISLAIPGSLSAQVVQLPTFQQFSVNTTVSVPDGGSAFLGGVTTARSGSNSNSVPFLGRLPVANRLFQNRGIGRDTGASRAYVTARIIDLNEMDEAVLQQARNARLANQQMQPRQAGQAPRELRNVVEEDPVEARARFLTRNMGRSSRNPRQTEFVSPRLSVSSRTRDLTNAPDLDRVAAAKRKSPVRKSPAASATPEPPLLLNGQSP